MFKWLRKMNKAATISAGFTLECTLRFPSANSSHKRSFGTTIVFIYLALPPRYPFFVFSEEPLAHGRIRFELELALFYTGTEQHSQLPAPTRIYTLHDKIPEKDSIIDKEPGWI